MRDPTFYIKFYMNQIEISIVNNLRFIPSQGFNNYVMILLISSKMHIKSGSQIKKVLVIGLAQLGLPVAKYVKESGFETVGYDIKTLKMEEAEKNYGIKRIEQFDDIDVFILCVSTHDPNHENTPFVDGLFSLAPKLSREAKNSSRVSIESTIPKGTSNTILELLKHRLHVAHAPHRWYAPE